MGAGSLVLGLASKGFLASTLLLQLFTWTLGDVVDFHPLLQYLAVPSDFSAHAASTAQCLVQELNPLLSQLKSWANTA